jgi:hypothetical protein
MNRLCKSCRRIYASGVSMMYVDFGAVSALCSGGGGGGVSQNTESLVALQHQRYPHYISLHAHQSAFQCQAFISLNTNEWISVGSYLLSAGLYLSMLNYTGVLVLKIYIFKDCKTAE